jgi:hypothetical protein
MQMNRSIRLLLLPALAVAFLFAAGAAQAESERSAVNERLNRFAGALVGDPTLLAPGAAIEYTRLFGTIGLLVRPEIYAGDQGLSSGVFLGLELRNRWLPAGHSLVFGVRATTADQSPVAARLDQPGCPTLHLGQSRKHLVELAVGTDQVGSGGAWRDELNLSAAYGLSF